MLDKLPPQVRHFILIIGGTFLGVMAKAIITANGVTGVHWAATATLALNTAIVTGVTAFMLLNLTPITKQYGAFADPAVTPNFNAPIVLAESPAPETLGAGVVV